MDKNNYFLGSVGRVDAFKMENGEPILAFVSKTMTDTGLNTSISADDIRGGQGAPIITRFYHDANVEITLTDVMFKKGYVEAQLGTEFEESGEAYITENHELKASGDVELDHTPITIGFGCEEAKKVIWYSKDGSNEWKLVPVSKIQENKILDLEAGDYCFRYLANGVLGASKADIYAGFVPEELHLIITTPLFAGDACSASGGTIAGEVQYDIPRFRLNGGQDFAAAMSSNQTTNLSGVALGSTSGCDVEGKGALLYSMIVKLNGTRLDDQYTSLEVDEETLKVGVAPLVYGVDAKEQIHLISNSELKFEPALNEGKFAEATAAQKISGKLEGDLSKTVEVEA